MKTKCKKLLAVLNALVRSSPQALGNSILTRDKAYKKLLEQIGNITTEEKIFCFTADIRNCYESIEHERLFACLDEFPDSVTYAFANFAIYNDNVALPVRWKTVAYQEGDIDGCLAQLGSPNGNITIITPGDWKCQTWPTSLATLLAQVKSIVANWSFQLVTGKFKIGDRGLVQGNSLASILAALYYGRIDRDLPHKDRSIVLRLVDDVLCVTGSETVAREISNAIIQRQMYGVVHLEKCTGNFSPFRSPVQWLGMELKPQGKMLNFQTMASDIPAKNACSVRITTTELTSKQLVESVTRSQRHRLIPILMSPQCNEHQTALLNAASAGNICGVRIVVTAQRFERVTGRPFPIQGVLRTVMRQSDLRRLDGECKDAFYKALRRRIRIAGLKFTKHRQFTQNKAR